MSGKILTVTFNPAIDRMVRHDRAGAPVFSFPGGKGINVARAARALGLRVEALALAGGASGELLHELLSREKLPHALAPVLGMTRTNTTRVYKDGRVRRTFEDGPGVTSRERRAWAQSVAGKAKGCGIVVLSGSLPPGYPATEFARLVRRLRRSGNFVAVDTSGNALKAVLHAGTDIIKPNRAEAQDVLGFRLTGASTLRKALRIFTGCGIKKVLISLGRDGLAASDGEQDLIVRVPVVRGGHAVGCGDAALAGFCAAHMKGRGFEDCVSLAAACGGANVLADVPGGIDRRNVAALLSRRKILWL